MTVALAALVIALCSLIWNVIAALHSWRTGIPLVRLTLSAEVSDNYEGLGVNVRNIGGSPIAVTSLAVWSQYSRRSKKGWQITSDESYDKDQEERDGISGPLLPITINGHHSERWKFDMVMRLNSQVASNFPKRLVAEAELATGRVAKEKLETDGYFDATRIDEIYDRLGRPQSHPKTTTEAITWIWEALSGDNRSRKYES